MSALFIFCKLSWPKNGQHNDKDKLIKKYTQHLTFIFHKKGKNKNPNL